LRMSPTYPHFTAIPSCAISQRTSVTRVKIKNDPNNCAAKPHKTSRTRNPKNTTQLNSPTHPRVEGIRVTDPRNDVRKTSPRIARRRNKYNATMPNRPMKRTNIGVPNARPQKSRDRSKSRKTWITLDHGSNRGSQVCTYDSHPQPVRPLTILGPKIKILVLHENKMRSSFLNKAPKKRQDSSFFMLIKDRGS
jgi:hypothetical protein